MARRMDRISPGVGLAILEKADLVVENLTRSFGSRRIVGPLSFRVPPGRVLGVAGPNGSGKTTVIKMLTGLLPLTAGEAWVDGLDVRVDAEGVRERIGYMSQRYGLYDDLTAYEKARPAIREQLLRVKAPRRVHLGEALTFLFENRDEGLWRRAWHTRNNANLYPTHGLGPVSWYLDVNAGDRYDYLVSVGGPHAGLEAHRAATVADKANPKWKEQYVTGDHNTSILHTLKGKTVMLQHDVSNPRQYTRHNRVQGTKGAFEDYPPRIYVDGQAGGERWATIDEWKAKFTHPLWAQVGELAKKKGGHGGMDFIMAYRLVQTMREGLAPDYDVYDAATWSAPFPLSEISMAKGSAPVKFPDFTRGAFASAR